MSRQSASLDLSTFTRSEGLVHKTIWVRTRDQAGNHVDEEIVELSADVFIPQTIQIQVLFVNSFGSFVNSAAILQKTVFPSKTPIKSLIGGIEYPYTKSFNELGLMDGPFTLITLDILGEPIETVPMILDDTPPMINLIITNGYGESPTYVKQSSTFTVTATDAGAGVTSTSYRVTGNSYDSEWVACSGAFTLSGLSNSAYTLSYKAVDNVGNTAESSTQITVDNSAPTTSIQVGNPRASLNHVTTTTPFTISSNDGSGSGVKMQEIRIACEGTDYGWGTYEGEFTLQGLSDGAYIIYARAEDNLGNKAETSLKVLVDETGPDVQILQPIELSALQGELAFRALASDVSGVVQVTLTIRDSDYPTVPTTYEDLDMMYDPVEEEWTLSIDTLDLLDGNYLVVVEASDALSNTAPDEAAFSIRNWATTTLLPSTPKSMAGRTMPLKFTMFVDSKVDPEKPPVFNEELVITICEKSHPELILQTSTFGDDPKSYRISDTGQYITNFKTLSRPTTYLVKIMRGSLQIASFEFRTTK